MKRRRIVWRSSTAFLAWLSLNCSRMNTLKFTHMPSSIRTTNRCGERTHFVQSIRIGKRIRIRIDVVCNRKCQRFNCRKAVYVPSQSTWLCIVHLFIVFRDRMSSVCIGLRLVGNKHSTRIVRSYSKITLENPADEIFRSCDFFLIRNISSHYVGLNPFPSAPKRIIRIQWFNINCIEIYKIYKNRTL